MQERSEDLHSLLEELRKIAASGNAEQMTLPPGVYHSAAIFERECERIFRPGWIMIGRVDQVPNPGDYMAVDLLNERLVMTRDANGDVHVMSRVCRHRWMEVCEGSGNARVLQCPYHAWSYDLDGQLRSAPEMADCPSYSPDELSLVRVRHEVWQGFVFVNLKGGAEPLGPHLAELEAEIAEYNLKDWLTVWSKDYGEMPWDWKVMQDNGDCYHHIGLHRQTLLEMWPLRLIWDKPNNGRYALTGCGTAADQLGVDAEGNPVMMGTFDPAPGLTQFQRENLFLIYIYPNYFIAPTPTEAFVARVFPVGPGRVRFITDLLAPPNALSDPELHDKAEQGGAFFDTINQEDMVACMTVQAALSSATASRGPLSSKERCVAQFAAWFAAQMTQD